MRLKEHLSDTKSIVYKSKEPKNITINRLPVGKQTQI